MVSSSATLRVRAQPRASRSELVARDADGTLRVRVAAPPVDGQANAELLRFLARDLLGVAPSSLEVLRGASGRDKVVLVRGLDAAEVERRLVGR